MAPVADRPPTSTDRTHEVTPTQSAPFQPLSGKDQDLAIIKSQNTADKTQTSSELPAVEFFDSQSTAGSSVSRANPATADSATAPTPTADTAADASTTDSSLQKLATALSPYLPMDNNDSLLKAEGMFLEGGLIVAPLDAINQVLDVPSEVKGYFDNSAAIASAKWPPPSATDTGGPTITVPNQDAVDNDWYGNLGEHAVPLILSAAFIAANPELYVDGATALAKGLVNSPKTIASLAKSLAEGDPSMGPSPEYAALLKKVHDEGGSVEQAITKLSDKDYSSKLPPLRADAKALLDKKFANLSPDNFKDEGEKIIAQAGQWGMLRSNELESAFKYLTDQASLTKGAIT